MNNDENVIQKYYAPFLSSKNHEYVSSESEYDSAKRRVCRNKNTIFGLLLNKSMNFEWQLSLLFFVKNNK